jgi:uncharacterized protein YutE (UPF0331/DUF86 family)
VTPSALRADIVADRVSWIRRMLEGLRSLPLESGAIFEADARNAAAAESYLRRALEALLDLGRHVLARGFGRAPTEYREIAESLVDAGVLDKGRGGLLREMAGYRNRLVHFYDEVTRRELYQICTERVGDVEIVLEAILGWIRADPRRADGAV